MGLKFQRACSRWILFNSSLGSANFLNLDHLVVTDLRIALGAILAGYWAAFALYPLPGAEFDYASVGVASDWPHLMTGFAAHWNMNRILHGRLTPGS